MTPGSNPGGPTREVIKKIYVLIVQWIERRPPKLEIEVRLLVGTHIKRKFFSFNVCPHASELLRSRRGVERTFYILRSKMRKSPAPVGGDSSVEEAPHVARIRRLSDDG